MKFLKLLQYDLGKNLLAKPIKWIVSGLLFLYFFLNFTLDGTHTFWCKNTLMENIQVFHGLEISVGDSLIYLTGGMLPIEFTSLTDNFQFPVMWLLPHITILYITLSYPSDDLNCMGIQVLTRMRSKYLWWLSKCLWNILSVVSCFVVGLFVWYLLSILTGKVMDYSLNEIFFNRMFHDYISEQNAANFEYIMCFIIMPIVVCITISLIQMALTLYIKPVFAYMMVCIYYIAGIYYANPVLISNYAMSSRSSVLGLYNFRPETGIVICSVFATTAIIIGVIRMKNKDLINMD